MKTTTMLYFKGLSSRLMHTCQCPFSTH